MANLDDDFDADSDAEEGKKKIDRKKILIFLLPALIAIGLVVSFYSVFSKKTGPQNLSYAVVERPGGTDGDAAQNKLTILYDIPEINVRIKDEAGTPQDVSLRLNIELTRMEDIQIVEGLMPKIVDAVIAHTIELTPDEISGSNGLYWLREELLYRINLIVSPVVVANLSLIHISEPTRP